MTFTIYIPPHKKAPELAELKEALSTEIGAAKCSLGDPVIVVMGDFNHRDVTSALDKDDMQWVPTGPTRDPNTINRVYMNALEHVQDTRVLPPIQLSSGVSSDHRCVFVDATFPPLKKYKWVVQFRRTRDEARECAVAEELRDHDWPESREM